MGKLSIQLSPEQMEKLQSNIELGKINKDTQIVDISVTYTDNVKVFTFVRHIIKVKK